jgi:hypothetical protein
MPDHALDSILDVCDLPVNEETDGMSAQLEIGKQPFLCGLRGSKYK